jgi:O-antigen/teichoic acid export membrane protein
VIICAAILLMPDLALHLAYGPTSPYLAGALSLQLLAIGGVLDYIAEMISKTLLGVEAGRAASAVNVLAVGVAAGLAFALIGSLGVVGACLALVIANLVRMIGGAIAMTMLVGSGRARKRAQDATIGGRS